MRFVGEAGDRKVGVAQGVIDAVCDLARDRAGSFFCVPGREREVFEYIANSQSLWIADEYPFFVFRAGDPARIGHLLENAFGIAMAATGLLQKRFELGWGSGALREGECTQQMSGCQHATKK